MTQSSQNPPIAGLKQHSSSIFFGIPHFLNKILVFWERVELDLDLDLSSIISFVYSFSKYFENILCPRFVLGAFFLRNYLGVLSFGASYFILVPSFFVK